MTFSFDSKKNLADNNGSKYSSDNAAWSGLSHIKKTLDPSAKEFFEENKGDNDIISSLEMNDSLDSVKQVDLVGDILSYNNLLTIDIRENIINWLSVFSCSF